MSLFIFLTFNLHFQNGPRPMQLVVVNAVRKAVSAATIIFTTISISLFFFIIINCQLDLIAFAWLITIVG